MLSQLFSHRGFRSYSPEASSGMNLFHLQRGRTRGKIPRNEVFHPRRCGGRRWHFRPRTRAVRGEATARAAGSIAMERFATLLHNVGYSRSHVVVILSLARKAGFEISLFLFERNSNDTAAGQIQTQGRRQSKGWALTCACTQHFLFITCLKCLWVQQQQR